ncbi:MAG: ribonuclease Z [Candidatus Micrarchaeota archaeon]|nr:ribonuclease Z [Candidatus Micrarchaeota archaeon]
MRIHFLGTNGWFPSRMGNTVCAAIGWRDRLLVLDAGDGFSKLAPLMAKLRVRKADVFLSHLHLDHAIGLHSLPLMPKGFEIRIFAHKSYLRALKQLIAHPYTATPEEEFAKVKLLPLKTGCNRLPYSVQLLPLKHADPCFGMRFELDGKAVAYCTDTGTCKNISRLANGADLLITECGLLPGSSPNNAWPHLSPEMAAGEAKKAGAHRLILSHFDANKYPSPTLRKRAQKAARKIFPQAIAAEDGMEFEI